MNIIKLPIITEKTLRDYKENNKVTFEVALEANKYQIKEAIAKHYDVVVLNVKIVNRLGKKRVNRLTNQVQRKSRDKKLAIATLDSKSKIDIFKGE